MSFSNPVYGRGFPDPFLMLVGSTYYAYATNGPLGNVQTLRSDDLVRWEEVGDAMPELAPWAKPGRTWAPEIARVDDRFVLYYTARGGEWQYIGRAVSASPEGPFVDDSTEPLLADDAGGGSIDASPFRDVDGTLYLYWKNDGNARGRDTTIWVQRCSDDGLSLVGERRALFHQDAAWEGAVVEGPVMWRHDGRYFLFYSGNAFDQASYAVGYAECDGPLGPARKAEENPILASSGASVGPGHNNLIDVDGVTWTVYHSWHRGAVGTDPGRTMWLDRVDWVDGRPVVLGPTDGPQEPPVS